MLSKINVFFFTKSVLILLTRSPCTTLILPMFPFTPVPQLWRTKFLWFFKFDAGFCRFLGEIVEKPLLLLKRCIFIAQRAFLLFPSVFFNAELNLNYCSESLEFGCCALLEVPALGFYWIDLKQKSPLSKNSFVFLWYDFSRTSPLRFSKACFICIAKLECGYCCMLINLGKNSFFLEKYLWTCDHHSFFVRFHFLRLIAE